MPKFVSARDYEFFQHINRELIDDVIDIDVILIKLRLEATPTNIYGEAIEKVQYVGVELPALIEYPENVSTTRDGYGVNQMQNVDFRFVQRILYLREVYPEVGDMVYYNNRYYEINNVRETQLIASRPEYNQSILCSAHLTRKSNLEIEMRQV